MTSMNDLMTLEDIARLMRCTSAKAKQIIALAGFPDEAPTSTHRHRLWLRAEVRAFKPLLRPALIALKQASAAAFLARSDAIDARSLANRRHHRSKRRTAELQRTPLWADLKAIEAIYREAVMLENVTGVAHAVDHVIPLQGRFVSGLHVANNLQVLTKRANISKGNRFEVVA